MFRKFVKACIKIFIRIIFRVEVCGQENIEDNKSYLLCANHVSNWDPLLLYTTTNRSVYMMAKEELFKTKFTIWFFNKMNIISVKRGKKDIDSIKKSIKILSNNNILAIFPEGTRNGIKKNGKIQNGPSYLAARTGAEVIPIQIEGNFKLFSKIKIKYLKPLDFSEYKSNKPEKEILDLISEKITISIFGGIIN